MKTTIWATTIGATHYEFAMQVRRKALWIAMIVTSLIVFTGLSNPWNLDEAKPLSVVIGTWAVVCNAFLPVVLGVLLADRLPRDRRLHLTELLDSLPASSGSHLTGKFFGSAFASAAPIFLIYLAGIAYIFERWHDPMTIPIALAAFLTINLPGLLFVAAFSIAVPAILWVPLYQFLFVGYWFWGNLLSPKYGIPTLSNTWLTPLGSFAASGFFSTRSSEIDTIMGGPVASWQGVMSIVILLAGGAIALLTTHQYLKWQHARQ